MVLNHRTITSNRTKLSCYGIYSTGGTFDTPKQLATHIIVTSQLKKSFTHKCIDKYFRKVKRYSFAFFWEQHKVRYSPY